MEEQLEEKHESPKVIKEFFCGLCMMIGDETLIQEANQREKDTDVILGEEHIEKYFRGHINNFWINRWRDKHNDTM